jgi:hypothetical protein
MTMLSCDDLQAMLRQFGGPLSNISVKPHNMLLDHARISGMANIHGKPHFFETDTNLREYAGTAEVLRLAGLLLQSFQKAEKGIPT